MSLASQVNAAFARVAIEIKRRGVPAGGAVGQVAVKIGAGDYTTGWADMGKGRMVRAYSTVQTTFGSNSAITVPLSAMTENDDATLYSISGTALKVARPGLYLVSFYGIMQLNQSASGSIFVQRNGTTLQEVGATLPGAGGVRLSGVTPVRLAANDLLGLGVFAYSAGYLQGSSTSPKEVGISVAQIGA